MRRSRRLYLAAVLAAAAFAACNLNPQPLPPGEEGPNAAQDGPGARFGMDAAPADAGALPPSPNPDADAEVSGSDADADADADASEAGDDAGDAGTD